ncbi:MAG: Ig-like domain-containing protein, partial [Chromatiales bacterium]
MKRIHQIFGGLIAATTLLSGSAYAASFDLVAAQFTKTLPLQDGTTQVVAIWGLAQGTTCPALAEWSGAPVLAIPPADTSLSVNLLNCLNEPVSLLAPALPKALSPVFVTDAQGRQRVRSMDTETPADGTTVVSYTWNELRPGTFLLHSGTLPGKQVPMGLYAAVTMDSAVGEAYPNEPYDTQTVMVFSEIDPILNAAVADGSYGTTAYPTSINYKPRYFLINGNADGSTVLPAAAVNGNSLVRLVNAGLRDLIPTVDGLYWDLVAEDGNPYSYAERQYSVRLPAGKTMDAVFVAAAEGSYAVYDRRMNITSDRNLAGGMFAALTVAAQSAGPIANPDSFSLPEDGTLDVPVTFALDGVTPLAGVLANDTAADGVTVLTVPPATANLTGSVTHGTLMLNADGSLSYTPNPDFNGVDSFTYRANDGTQNSNETTVTITVDPVADAPVAVADAYETTVDNPLPVSPPGVLGNDIDVDGAGISVNNVNGVPVDGLDRVTALGGTVTVQTDGSFVYTPPAGVSGSDSFTYDAIGAGG